MDFLAALPGVSRPFSLGIIPGEINGRGMRGAISGLFTCKKMLKLKQQHSHPLVVMPLDEPRARFFLPPDAMNCPSRLEGPQDTLARRFGTLGNAD